MSTRNKQGQKGKLHCSLRLQRVIVDVIHSVVRVKRQTCHENVCFEMMHTDKWLVMLNCQLSSLGTSHSQTNLQSRSHGHTNGINLCHTGQSRSFECKLNDSIQVLFVSITRQARYHPTPCLMNVVLRCQGFS